MQLVSFLSLPMFCSLIHASTAAPSTTDNKVEILARQVATDSTDGEKCIITIEFGDCDTYQTCTKDVKVTGNCTPQKQQGLKSVHCNFSLPRRKPGKKDPQNVSGIHCLPSLQKHGAHRNPNVTTIISKEHHHDAQHHLNDTTITSKEHHHDAQHHLTGTTITSEEHHHDAHHHLNDTTITSKEHHSAHRLPNGTITTHEGHGHNKHPGTVPEYNHAPLPKFPPRICEQGHGPCKPETWYYIPPNCVPDAKVPEKCDPIPRSVCDQTPDKCDPCSYKDQNLAWLSSHPNNTSHPESILDAAKDKLPKYPQSSDFTA